MPTLLTTSEGGAVSQVAAALRIDARDVWLPMGVYAPARSKETAAVDIPDTTPMVLRDAETGELFFDRQDILMKLCMLDISDGRGLRLAPADVPASMELYLRWDRPPGTKRVPAGTSILSCTMTDQQALAAGSVVAPSCGVAATARGGEALPAGEAGGRGLGARKRRRVASSGHASSRRDSVDGSTLADSVQGAREEEAVVERAAAELDERLAAALVTVAHQSPGVAGAGGSADGAAAAHRANATRAYATNKLAQCHRLPPLHLLPPPLATATGLELPPGVHWRRPDPRVLCRVWRRQDGSGRTAAGGGVGAAARQVVFFFAEDLIFGSTGGPAGCVVGADGVAAEIAGLLEQRRRRVARAMGHYAQRGYRVVVMDHLPCLHHGSLLAAEASLGPLVRFITEEGIRRAPSVTVLLSIVSRITASQRRGISASFLMPNTGLLQFFTTELNASLEVDRTASEVVGTRHRGSPFLDEMHATFARNAGLRFVEVESLGEAVVDDSPIRDVPVVP